MTDITESSHIKLLVDSFYEKALRDDHIGHIFTVIAKIDMAHHMPIMYRFWESILLGIPNYKGNLMGAHIALNRRYKLNSSHFERWKELFLETLDSHFSGPKVDECKSRVNAMIALMQIKLEQSEKPGFIQ